ncbi:hypothetical protein [Reyranella sp.]|uniref:hypothetical protein n=1 Tax=Reyranella sp. TaxID=1929291 RepID=UPI003D1150AD
MRRLFLTFPPDDGTTAGWIALRNLRGGDEEAIGGTDTAAAIGLLDRLLVDTKGAALRPGEADRLTACDRDRLLAEIYVAEFGDRIDCVLRCEACGSPFDIDFKLGDLLASAGLLPVDIAFARNSTVTLDDGRRLRLPRGSDELALQGMSAEAAEAALLARCIVEGDAAPGDLAVHDALEAAAPILDTELDATCPECGAPTQTHFDLQHYLLTSILQEMPARTAEVHLLASTYGWSLHEILELDRKRRRAFAAAIERDRGAHAGSF